MLQNAVTNPNCIPLCCAFKIEGRRVLRKLSAPNPALLLVLHRKASVPRFFEASIPIS
jgi:hypothetical protein